MAFLARLDGTLNLNDPLLLMVPVVAVPSRPMAEIFIPLPPLTVPDTVTPCAMAGTATTVAKAIAVQTRGLIAFS